MPLRGRDIVCFANDWDGDPLSKTHVMRVLARDARVLWVNSLGNRTPRATAADAAKIARKLRAAARGLVEVERNVHVLAPVFVPAYGAAARRANAALLAAQIRRAMRRLALRRPISWCFLPAAATVAGRLGESLVVYHVVDEFSAFSDASPHVGAHERSLLARADLVVAASERLFEAKRRHHPRTVLVRHGGHAAAAGFTVKNENLAELVMRLKQIASDKLGSTDLMPTLLELTGQPVPKAAQGQSLVPYLTGRADPSKARAYSFCERVARAIEPALYSLPPDAHVLPIDALGALLLFTSLSHVENGPAIFGSEIVRVIARSEGECPRCAAVEHGLLHLLHFVHPRHVMRASVDAAAVHVPRPARIDLASAAVVRDLDQPYRLVLLKTFSHRAVRTADVMTGSPNLGNH